MGYYMKLPFWLYPKHWGLKGFLYELARIEYDFDNKDTLIYIMAINDLKLKHHMMSETEHAHSLLNYKLKSGIITERRFLEELASLKESPEKELEDLDKNMPKMGGKDPMSRMMTTHAMGDAAKKAPIQSQSAAAIFNAKLPSPAQHAQRAETFSDFMPKGKFSKNELIKEMESMDKWTPKA